MFLDYVCWIFESLLEGFYTEVLLLSLVQRQPHRPDCPEPMASELAGSELKGSETGSAKPRLAKVGQGWPRPGQGLANSCQGLAKALPRLGQGFRNWPKKSLVVENRRRTGLSGCDSSEKRPSLKKNVFFFSAENWWGPGEETRRPAWSRNRARSSSDEREVLDSLMTTLLVRERISKL